ncbi:MAG TPA: hypothetical protein DCS66_10690 [Flavobacteriaceae bacterium]|nr:hypothetical protein [Flavobacteriaceae bacterium]HAT65053.1 hypothetical protein [Flavobacteriaceae bacterium]
MRYFIFILFLPCIVFSQDISEKQRLQNIIDTTSTISSKVQLYIDLAWEYTLEENDSALIFTKRAYNLSKKNNYTLGEAIALESKGLYHEIVTGKYDLASQFYFDGIAVCEKNGLPYATSIYHSLGVMFHTSDNYEKALEYYSIAYERSKKDEDTVIQKKCLINMGSIYSSLQDFEKAEELMQKSLTLDVRRELDYSTYANLGNLFIRQEKFKEAIPYLEKATEIHPDNSDSEENIMYLVEAKAALKDSVGMKGKINRLQIALENLNALRAKSNIHRSLALYYEAFGDFQTALKHQKEYLTLYEEIKENQRDQTVYDLETKYQTEKKERELEKKKANEQLLFIILGSLGILLILISFFFYKNRKKNSLLARQKKLLETNVEEKNILLKEIHHRVKNNLQVISSLLSLQQRQITDSQASQAIQEGRDRVKAMALIHQNLYQDTNLIGVEAKEYITKLASNLIANYKTNTKKIAIKTDIDQIKLDVDTMIPLGLIINELISNALKYAFENKESGAIEITLKDAENLLHLSLKDNGKGLPKDFSVERSESLGFRLIKAFSEKLKANLTINSSENGTHVSMDIINYKTV